MVAYGGLSFIDVAGSWSVTPGMELWGRARSSDCLPHGGGDNRHMREWSFNQMKEGFGTTGDGAECRGESCKRAPGV
ncbi:putative pre-16S rRNA nuclease [Clarias magur]|uniref:Putative pre-16S rRNA nuclease n=1 Tax=Clarias magur TaxID=1594786 RepID=A0A8J4U2T3_CLAMG|nr:putative pre-16S rRNA nuclease [Clarias magur]